jgi:hypothetical protein
MQVMQNMQQQHNAFDALFREYNARSIEVYEWAEQRFKERWGGLFNDALV